MNINSYFTKQTDVRNVILEHLDNANIKVLVAVAWFTDTILFEKLLELQDKGVSIELIVTKHEFNTESQNDYELIKDKGFFAEIGSDRQLMHMKFCVIDYDIVISGSANWTNRAFTSNNEEVTIVSGNQDRTNDFISEFERLKHLSGKNKSKHEDLSITKAFKYFKLIKTFIELGEIKDAQPYIYQLKEINKFESIANLLLNGNYEGAFDKMEELKNAYSQLVDVNEYKKAQVLSQIKLLSFQIEMLEIKKSESEALIEQFNHRYILELNPLITKLLALKKKIFNKLKKYGVIDDTYENLKKEFNQKNKEYLKEKEIVIPDLSMEESSDLKQMYREAVKLCHPDSPSCIYKDKKVAASVFTSLTDAFKRNDLEKVKYIWQELKHGNPIDNKDRFNELEHLVVRLETLKASYNRLMSILYFIQASETYQLILSIDDWDAYFEKKKNLLKVEYDHLIKKYVSNE